MTKQLKQFLVCGASTGGKSTFATELVKKYHIQHVQIDPIIEGFEDVFPQLGITHNALTHKKHLEVCEKFCPFLCRMIDGLDSFDFVIEGFRMPLKELHDRYGHTHSIITFGYPHTTPAQKLQECREFDTENWTNDCTDDELLKIFEFLIQESIFQQQECLKLNIPFFDTGNDYWAKINEALALVGEKYGK